MLKAIIFDLDGVITDTAEYHYLAWKKTAESLHIPFNREFNEELKGVSRVDSLHKILDYGKVRDTYTEAEIQKLAKEKNDYYQTLIEKITPADLLPGIENFLRECKEAGIKIGLASASKNAPVILERLGITAMFDTIVDPSTLKNGKPDPEIFAKGAEQLGVPVDQCVGIEDAEAGIQSIKGARMFAVGVGVEERMKEANWIIDSTEKLTLTSLMKQFQR